MSGKFFLHFKNVLEMRESTTSVTTLSLLKSNSSVLIAACFCISSFLSPTIALPSLSFSFKAAPCCELLV